MTVHGLGVGVLTALMRSERRRDIDSSWLLFGPEESVEEEDTPEEDASSRWSVAAE